MRATALRELPWRKIFGAIAVAVLHVVIVMAFLHATFAPKHRMVAVRETIFYLRPLPKPRIEKRIPLPHKPAPHISAPYPNVITLPQSQDETAKAVQGLGRTLFDCRPENLSTLSAEQRAQCADRDLKPNDSVDYADHSRAVKDSARWARQKQRKNGPALLPCASPYSIFATLSAATLLCLAKGAVNGIDLDAQPMYGDRPEESHAPNNGDPPPAYTTPDH